MYPYAGNPYQLHALDDNWSVVVSERPSINEAYDAAIWDRSKVTGAATPSFFPRAQTRMIPVVS